MTAILNRRDLSPGWEADPRVIYVGRPTPWGNPYKTNSLGRDWAISQFRAYAIHRLQTEPEWLDPLRGATALVCWCAPLACHAEVLIELLTVEEYR